MTRAIIEFSQAISHRHLFFWIVSFFLHFGAEMVKKKKKIFPLQLPPEILDEEIEVSNEDLAFVNEHEKYGGFLVKLDTNLINWHVTCVADHNEEELEALYEKRRTKAAVKKAKEEEGFK